MTSPDKARSGSLDEILASMQSVDSMARGSREAMERLLCAEIFCGLDVQHPGFDSISVSHFDAENFRTVIRRCARLGLKINGVEVFTSKGELLEISLQELRSDAWCLYLLEKYRGDNVSFCASYL
jgi:hypothetical protein